MFNKNLINTFPRVEKVGHDNRIRLRSYEHVKFVYTKQRNGNFIRTPTESSARLLCPVVIYNLT